MNEEFEPSPEDQLPNVLRAPRIWRGQPVIEISKRIDILARYARKADWEWYGYVLLYLMTHDVREATRIAHQPEKINELVGEWIDKEKITEDEASEGFDLIAKMREEQQKAKVTPIIESTDSVKI